MARPDETEFENKNKEEKYRRAEWDPLHPTLISEALFAIANIFSFMRLSKLKNKTNSHLRFTLISPQFRIAFEFQSSLPNFWLIFIIQFISLIQMFTWGRCKYRWDECCLTFQNFCLFIFWFYLLLPMDSISSIIIMATMVLLRLIVHMQSFQVKLQYTIWVILYDSSPNKNCSEASKFI